MKVDQYGEVINSPDTYKAIAERLKDHHAVLIGWSDENSSHFDILFNNGADADLGQIINGIFVADQFLSANFRGGIRPNDLFVSIMRVGSFGFELRNVDTDWGYYNEKLGSRIDLGETTGQKLADLINGVKKELLK